jgi:hypothetical protein
MSAKEALEYVGKISACDQAMAFDQIRRAARDGVLQFLTPQETVMRNVGGSPSLTERDECKMEAAIEGQRAAFLLADESKFEINYWGSEGFEFCREDVLRIWPDTNVIVGTGAAGRPTSWHLVEPEAERLIGQTDCPKTLKNFSVQLAQWLKRNYPQAPRMTPKAIENKARPIWHKRPQN